jgi:hypothetical protein
LISTPENEKLRSTEGLNERFGFLMEIQKKKEEEREEAKMCRQLARDKAVPLWRE